MIIPLDRIIQSENSTMGTIYTGSGLYSTLELPWRNNQRGISCIPEGEYECRRVISPKFGETFQVMNVPGRSQILFHAGDLVSDTHGCIIIGQPGCNTEKTFEECNSGLAFKNFMNDLKGTDRFRLSISKRSK